MIIRRQQKWVTISDGHGKRATFTCKTVDDAKRLASMLRLATSFSISTR